MSVEKLHHIGIAVASLEESERFYVNTLGMTRVAGIIHDPIQKVNAVLLSYVPISPSAPMIELIEPASTPSPIDRFIDSNSSIFHYCIEVADIDEAVAAARKNGVIVIQKPVPAPLFDNRRIAWLLSPAGHLTELLESATSNAQ